MRLLNRSYRGEVRSDELLRNLDTIALSGAVGMILTTHSSGVALTGYASAFGAGAFMFGLISALPVLGGMMQLLVSYLIGKTGKRKLLFFIGGITHRGLWLLTSAIPLIVPDAFAAYRIWVLLIMITLAAMGSSFVGVAHTSMIAEVIPMHIRGRYLTTRQRMMMALSAVSGFGVALVLDNFTGFSGYSFVFLVAGLAGLADILMYVKFRFPENKRDAAGSSLSLAGGFRECFRSKKTRSYVVFFIVWSFAMNISSAFYNKYAIDVLRLTYTEIIILGQTTSNIMSLLIVKRWGRFMDRYGCVPLMLISGTMTAVTILVWMPAELGNFLPLLAFNAVGGLFWCANDVCTVNMQLTHTPDIGRPVVLAVYAVVTSISSGVAFIAGGAFLELFAPIMSSARLTFMGASFDHYKLLFVISMLLRLVAVFVFLPRVWNEKGKKTSDVYLEIFRRFTHNMRMLRVAAIVVFHKYKLRVKDRRTRRRRHPKHTQNRL